ncbi:phosphatase PAP2 family protein [Streptomyces pinistramenti]|uniref:phosphatase PAP2 family protein n=1 Tax=Streptomyces pinistramenti TaxID=2884812 RepID=UPI001D0707B1|nr:phosphatase PAP2 family protein [Streptomyces pinistramenti]MCB5911579.1 phosphatase PAP2 family protein [Streptomyces pinistramenti]
MNHHDHTDVRESRPDPATAAPAALAGTAGPLGHLTRLRPAALFLLAFVAVYLLAVCTPFGQRAENSLVVGYADDARIFRWAQSLGPPPLTAEHATLIVGIVLIAVVAVVRRRRLAGVAAVAVAVATLGAAEVLNKMVLPRPDLSHAPQNLVEASFPSGHVAIAAGLVAGALLIASPRTRPYVAAAGALWLAVTAAAVQALYWHRPSDALGATLLACAAYALATRLLPSVAPEVPSRPRALPALFLAVAGAVPAGSRTDAFARPLVFAAFACICAALLWLTAMGRPALPRRS